MAIKFGPSGLGSVKDAISRLEEYNKLGFKACEIAFTYGAYIKEQADAEKIGQAAKKLGIKLSIHAPYWINLNSEDSEKIEKSKERILKSLEVGHWLGAYRIVFHPGYYGKIKRTKVPLINPSFKLGVNPDVKKQTYQNIKKQILEIQKIRKEKGYTPELAPETTGKVNVFGSAEEIAQLVRDTGCSFCIDFAHILAREKSYNFEKILGLFKNEKKLHIHFSGIEYGEKGEKKHKRTDEKELKQLLENLPKDKDIVVISESPEPVKDSTKALDMYSN